MLIPETEIIVTRDGVELARRTVGPGDYTLGRASASDIAIDSEEVSRQHARLIVNYSENLVEDLGSTGGTFLAGARVSKATRIYSSQALRLGEHIAVELHRIRTPPPPDVPLAPAAAARSLLPDSLAAVALRALALDPAARYATVQELQGDLLAYQKGFATRAERAGAWKQIALLIKPHKAGAPGRAALLPTLEQPAALPPGAPWPPDAGPRLLAQLQRAGASGEVIHLSRQIKLSAGDKEKLVQPRLDEWLGKGKSKVTSDQSGLLKVGLGALPIDTLEPLRGLPIDRLEIGGTRVVSLEPFRGMHLVSIDLSNTAITDLSPLQGMPLTYIAMNGSKVSDLSPLRGAPLETLSLGGYTTQLKGYSPLLDLPKLEKLRLPKPRLPSKDVLRGHPTLKFIAINDEPFRPVAEFWAELNAQPAAGEK